MVIGINNVVAVRYHRLRLRLRHAELEATRNDDQVWEDSKRFFLSFILSRNSKQLAD